VNAQGDPVVELLVVGPGGQEVVSRVVDTGSTSALMLPAAVAWRAGAGAAGECGTAAEAGRWFGVLPLLVGAAAGLAIVRWRPGAR
jgi:hypothetical protein